MREKERLQLNPVCDASQLLALELMCEICMSVYEKGD